MKALLLLTAAAALCGTALADAVKDREGAVRNDKAAMEKDRLTKAAMAARMHTSRRALDRLLDPPTGIGGKSESEPTFLSRVRFVVFVTDSSP